MLWQLREKITSWGISSTASLGNQDYPAVFSMVWHHLECCVQFCSPQFKKNVKVLEHVHEKAPNMVKGLAGMSCEEWLKDFGVFSFEEKEAKG